MADSEHFALLKQGAETWNKWRDANPGIESEIEIDLKGAPLNGADLRGANLSGTNLCRAELCRADLRGANLYGADLRWADLRGADLTGVDLNAACGLEDVILDGAIGID